MSLADAESIVVRDYNGTAEWSWQSIQERYKTLCEKLNIPPRILEPYQHSEGNVLWIYPVMNQVIEGIVAGEAACTQLGVEFIEQDRSFPFGYLLKYNTARALRRTPLTEEQKRRIRKRVCSMFLTGYWPRELREYVRLLKSVGFEEYREQLIEGLSRENPYAARWRLRLGL
jgi:hypothetical protein